MCVLQILIEAVLRIAPAIVGDRKNFTAGVIAVGK